MAKPLRKTLEIELFGEPVPVDIDFRVVEILERGFNRPADELIRPLSTMTGVQRRHVADVICDWVARVPNLGWKRLEIREHVMTAPPEVYYRWVAQLSTALLYCLKHMSDEEFDRIKREIAEGKVPDAAGGADPTGTDGEDPEKKT
jgi:hypothetical protein